MTLFIGTWLVLHFGGLITCCIVNPANLRSKHGR